VLDFQKYNPETEWADPDSRNINPKIINLDSIKSNNHLTLVTWNIAGKNIIEAFHQIITLKPNVKACAFLETWREEEIKWTPHDMITLQMPATRKYSKGRASGGLFLIIHKSLKPKVFTQMSNWFKIRLSILETNIWWIPTYLPPLLIKTELLKYESLITKLSLFPIIISGDLNARISTFNNNPPEISDGINLPFHKKRQAKDTTVNSRGKWLIDLMERANLTPLNGLTKSDPYGEISFLAHQGQSTPDLTLYSLINPPQLIDFEIGTTILSDHFPQFTTLGTNQCSIKEKINIYLKLKYQITDIEKQAITNQLNELTLLADNQKLNENNIQSQILRVLKQNKLLTNVDKHHISLNYPKWWDLEIKTASLQLKHSIETFRKDNTAQSKEKYIEQRKKWLILKTNIKKTYDRKILQKMKASPNNNTFWKLIKSSSKNQQKTPKLISEQAWISSFSQIYNIVIPPQVMWHGVGIFDPILEGNFTMIELENVLRKQNNNTSPGPDLIPSFIIKNPSNTWRKFLLRILNQIFQSQIIPGNWTQTKIIPIHKQGPLDKPENYRPIAVNNIITKTFTAILANRIQLWAETHQILQEEQNAFRPQRSTMDHIFILKALIDKKLSKKSKLYAAFVDLKKAFDSIEHELLWTKLTFLGLPSRLINIIRKLYNKMFIVQIDQHTLITPIRITKGVLQGDPLSSILFNLFLSDVDSVMKEDHLPKINLFHSKLEINYLLFADDIVLLADNQLYLQKLLNATQTYVNTNRLKINEDKTKVLIFKKGGHRNTGKESFFINSKQLEIVNQYKYLGVTLHSTGKFHKTAKELVKQSRQKIDAMWPILTRAKLPKFANFLQYFDSVILPGVAYAAQIWAQDYSEILEMSHTYFLRKLLLIFPPRAANYFVRLELGRRKIQSRIMLISIKYHFKLFSMPATRLPHIFYTDQLLTRQTASQNMPTNWLNTYNCFLNKFGSSLEDIHRLFQVKDSKALANFMTKVDTTLFAQDLLQAQKSNTYKYYAYPFISHITPTYALSDWPIYLKRLNASLRNQSLWIPLGKHNKIQFYKFEKCPLCNASDSYNIYHILVQCKQLIPYRKFLSFLHNSFPEDKYVHSFSNLTLKQLKEIYCILCTHASQIELTM